jgi:hypothetical protein
MMILGELELSPPPKYEVIDGSLQCAWCGCVLEEENGEEPGA